MSSVCVPNRECQVDSCDSRAGRSGKCTFTHVIKTAISIITLTRSLPIRMFTNQVEAKVLQRSILN
jgi:hypothetical protein